MNAKELLDQVGIPTPCRMDWDQMTGDDRGRNCESCGKHVYNISRITVDAARFLALAKDGELCGRVTLQADGAPLTFDGQPAYRQPSPYWQFHLRSIMAVIAGIAATLGFARLFPPPEKLLNVPPFQLNAQRNLVVMGKMVPRSNLMPAPQNPPSTPSK
jgi:hypothetical protein